MSLSMSTSELPPLHGTSPFGTLAAESELRHFLKLARPEWSKPRRRGRSDVARVLAKLKAIGITDVETLIRMVETNTINEELYSCGLVPLSRESLDSIRKRKTFVQALESVDVPNIRQVGVFDPVAQMLSRKRLQDAGAQKRSPGKGEEGPSRQAPARSARTEAAKPGHASFAAFDPPGVEPEPRPKPWPRLRGVQRKSVELELEEGGPVRSHSYSDSVLLEREHRSSSSWMSDKESSDSWRRTRANTGPLPDAGASRETRVLDAPSFEEMLALSKAGQRILHSLEDRQSSAAKWSPKSRKTALEQGEEMLAEQDALDERERLVRLVKSKSTPPDPFRSHIAGNIKQRLVESAHHDSKEGLAINQRCLNIRKQLAGMINARKELASLRAKVHLMVEDQFLPRHWDGYPEQLQLDYF